MELNEYDAGRAGVFASVFPTLVQIIVILAGGIICIVVGKSSENLLSSALFIWFLLALTQFTFLIIGSMPFYRKKLNFKLELGLDKKLLSAKKIIICIVFTVGILFFFNPIVIYFVELLKIFGYTQNENMIPDLVGVNYFIAVIVVGIMPAVCEELVFRGVVLGGIKNLGYVFSITMSAILFTLMHANIEQLVYQIFLGAVLAFVMLEFKTIILPMIMHFVNNFTVLTVSAFVPSGGKLVDTWYFIAMGVGAVIVATITILYFTSRSKKLKLSDNKDNNLSVEFDNDIISLKNGGLNEKEVATKRSVFLKIAMVAIVISLMFLVINLFG